MPSLCCCSFSAHLFLTVVQSDRNSISFSCRIEFVSTGRDYRGLQSGKWGLTVGERLCGGICVCQLIFSWWHFLCFTVQHHKNENECLSVKKKLISKLDRTRFSLVVEDSSWINKNHHHPLVTVAHSCFADCSFMSELVCLCVRVSSTLDAF